MTDVLANDRFVPSHLLQNNARISVLMLAEHVNLSPTPCARRLRRLEDEGVIEKYTTVVNPKFLGFDVTAFVGVRVRHSPKWATKLAAAMQQLPNLRGCYTVTGSYDFLLLVNLKDMQVLRDGFTTTCTAFPRYSIVTPASFWNRSRPT